MCLYYWNSDKYSQVLLMFGNIHFIYVVQPIMETESHQTWISNYLYLNYFLIITLICYHSKDTTHNSNNGKGLADVFHVLLFTRIDIFKQYTFTWEFCLWIFSQSWIILLSYYKLCRDYYLCITFLYYHIFHICLQVNR